MTAGIDVADVAAAACLHGCLCFFERNIDRIATNQKLVETGGKFGGHLVRDRLAGCDDYGHACVEQTLHLWLVGAAVEKDQLQATLVGQVGR